MKWVELQLAGDISMINHYTLAAWFAAVKTKKSCLFCQLKLNINIKFTPQALIWCYSKLGQYNV